MPLRQAIAFPHCEAPLVRKPGGKCPACGTSVHEHVAAARNREERIEKVVAIVATALVVCLVVVTAGMSLIEGVLAYAAAGAVIFLLARKTF